MKPFKRKFMYFDMENSNTLNTFLCGLMFLKDSKNPDSAVYTSFYFRKGDDISYFLRMINYRCIVVYNAGYDINHLIDMAPDLHLEEKRCKVSSKTRTYLFECAVRYKGFLYQFEVFDLWGLYASSLSAVAKLYGMEKLDNKGLVNVDEETFKARLGDIIRYNRQDLAITLHAHKHGTGFYSKIGSDVLGTIFGRYIRFRFCRSLTIASISYKLLLTYCAIYDVLNHGAKHASFSEMKETRGKRMEVFVKRDHIRIDYMNRRYVYERTHEIRNEFFMGYRGGIVINEFVKTKDVHFYDVNSLYPHAMRRMYLNLFVSSDELDNGMVFDENYYGIAEVSIMRCNLPLGLMIFDEENKKNMSSVWDDRLVRMFLPFSELRLLSKVCGKDSFEIHRARGKRALIPLAPLSETLYSLRLKYKAEKNTFEHAIKLFMNSGLYGKLGTQNSSVVGKIYFNDTESMVYFVRSIRELDAEKQDELLHELNVKVMQNSVERRYSLRKRFSGYFIIISETCGILEDFYAAAEITGNARCVIQEYTGIVKARGGIVHAVDTDSIKTDLPPEMLSDVVDKSRFGALKYEGKAEEFISIRKKFYGFNNGDTDGKKPIYEGVRPVMHIKGVQNFSVTECSISEHELWKKVKEAVESGCDCITVPQERRASFEYGSPTMEYEKKIMFVKDGGLMRL